MRSTDWKTISILPKYFWTLLRWDRCHGTDSWCRDLVMIHGARVASTASSKINTILPSSLLNHIVKLQIKMFVGRRNKNYTFVNTISMPINKEMFVADVILHVFSENQGSWNMDENCQHYRKSFGIFFWFSDVLFMLSTVVYESKVQRYPDRDRISSM